MDIYLVGGAVRDRLLGLPVVDRDWVVVGSTPEDMIAAGFLPVGRDFPVFLHPDTHEEYALARTERKTSPGYSGFTFHTAADVTLEDDLRRRDLTINAIAEDTKGRLIDPFNGQSDLRERQLRHVTGAFSEDPVRLLRVARFHARFASLGFTIADQTLESMRAIVATGEVDALVAERVWQEIDKALTTDQPRLFFETLRECGALGVILPEVDALFGVPQPPQWHPEIDTGVHTMMVLEQVCKLTEQKATRFAVLCHDLGKALTPKDQLPSHHGHEEVSARLSDTLCKRLRVPGPYRDLARLVACYHTHVHRIQALSASKLTKLLMTLDVLRKPERFEEFVRACEADARGRSGLEQRAYKQADYLRGAAAAFQTVDAASIAGKAEKKGQIAAQIQQARVLALKQYVNHTRTGSSG